MRHLAKPGLALGEAPSFSQARSVHVVALATHQDLQEVRMAIDEEEEDLTTYKVVVNHEEQYSIWPVDRENPLGWEDRGITKNNILFGQ